MKRDSIIIIAIIVIIGVLISSFVYNQPQNLAKRTLAYDIPEEATIVQTRRYGVLYWTRGYQMKIQINHDNANAYLNLLAETYGQPGDFLSYAEYQDFAASIFNEKDIVPIVEANTTVYVSVMQFADGVELIHIIASTSADEAYMYVYWSKA